MRLHPSEVRLRQERRDAIALARKVGRERAEAVELAGNYAARAAIRSLTRDLVAKLKALHAWDCGS